MRDKKLQLRQWIAGRTAKFMFALSLVFLFCQAVLVVLLADVPMLVHSALVEVDADSIQADRLKQSLAAPPAQQSLQSLTQTVMYLIWPIFLFESLFHWVTRPWDRATRKYHFFGFLFCICPSLRMCARSPELGSRIWLPGLGWRQANKRLRARLERLFSFPMIMIALLIMPVLIVEFFLKNQVAEHAWLRLSLHISTGVIWFAFAAEFILMVSVADKKLDYCKKHWIDLAIILMPFISYLRSMRLLRATRAASWLRVTQISKFARMYRLRGTAVKAFRGLILLGLFQRLAGGTEGKITRMQRRLADLETEATYLRRQITRLQRKQADAAAEDDWEEAEAPIEEVEGPPRDEGDLVGHSEGLSPDAIDQQPQLTPQSQDRL